MAVETRRQDDDSVAVLTIGVVTLVVAAECLTPRDLVVD